MLDIILALAIALHTPGQNLDTKQLEEITVENSPIMVRKNSSRPYLSARAGLVLDINSKTILHQKNIHQKLPIASTTKLMTAIIVIEENDLNEVVTITSDAISIGGSSMNLSLGEKITVENLLKGLLIKSGNDAAIALAIHNAGSVDTFVNKMNSKARELGLKGTNFNNPQGFDDIDNYSTAYDLSIIGLKLFQSETVKEIVKTESETVSSTDGRLRHSLVSTNELLGSYLNVIGLKTGHTAEALGCFIGITDEENPKLSIILGSNNRFLESKILLDWAKNTFEYQ